MTWDEIDLDRDARDLLERTFSSDPEVREQAFEDMREFWMQSSGTAEGSAGQDRLKQDRVGTNKRKQVQVGGTGSNRPSSPHVHPTSPNLTLFG